MKKMYSVLLMMTLQLMSFSQTVNPATEFSYNVGIYRNNVLVGNGILYSQSTVIVPASLVEGTMVSSITVRLGMKVTGAYTQTCGVSSYVTHPMFGTGPDAYSNNIALISLSSLARVDNVNISLIAIHPTASYQSIIGQIATITGVSTLYPSNMVKYNGTIITQQEACSMTPQLPCEALGVGRIPVKRASMNFPFFSKFYGAALIYQGAAVGFFSYARAVSTGSTTTGPVYFTDLTAYRNWIASNTAKRSRLDATATGEAEADEVAFRVYPNPTASQVNVQMDNETNYAVSIYSIDGRLVASSSNNFGPSTISIEDQPIGIYSIIVTTAEDKVYRQQIIKN